MEVEGGSLREDRKRMESIRLVAARRAGGKERECFRVQGSGEVCYHYRASAVPDGQLAFLQACLHGSVKEKEG